jgi:hypothetical protein
LRDEDCGVHLRADLKASKTVSKQAGLTWPIPADRRLDQLVELANEAGAATHRNELAAATIATTEAEGEALLQLVLRWRRARVGDVVLDVTPESEIVYLPRYGPGRRKADSA